MPAQVPDIQQVEDSKRGFVKATRHMTWGYPGTSYPKYVSGPSIE